MQDSQKKKNRIRDWKGLLHDEPFRTKVYNFLALFILSTSMTFTQYGFIGIGSEGQYIGYALGLLVPLTAVTLLFGKGAGTLFGALSGAVLYAHARWQPLDLFERYFVSSLTSILFYMFVGFALGLILANALHNNPTGKRRIVYFAISAFFASLFASILFFINGIVMLAFSAVNSAIDSSGTVLLTSESTGAFAVLSGLDTQMIVDLLLIFGVCLVVDFIVRKRAEAIGDMSVSTAFRTQLFVVAALVFCVVQAVSFVVITRSSEQQAYNKMGDELDYLEGRLRDEIADMDLVVDTLSPYIIPENASADNEPSPTAVIPENVAIPLISSHGVSEVLEGYDLTDGTIVIFFGDTVACSYSPAFPLNSTVSELFDTWRTGTLDQVAESTRPQEMLYNTRPHGELSDLSDASTQVQLGYMRVKKVDGYYIMMAMPSSMVFANRWSTVAWASVTAAALLAAVYILATRLLNKDVVTPIDRTNDSLAKITSGDLDETVNENDNREFASLSAGINQTVDSLKGLIAEAERRNERDLAVAKRIQESALPRTFPPFPEISAFDIFAAMDAAKEVGGDFFDFFLVDDQTLGFLIADVSGKGIPGALFMMAAKAEIENYLSTGMEPAEAIASANRRLCANNDAGMFVTVWAATLNWKTGELTYVNAGHNFPLLRHQGKWEWLKKKCGLFLGTFETAKYRQETIVIEPGDELVLYTDGVNEAFNPSEEEYGNDRLEAFLAAHADVHPRELVRALRSDVAAWADGAEQSDDVTILALEYGVAPEVTGSLTVPATMDHLGDAISLVSGELERRLCPVGVLNKVEMALEELFVNVCRYAYADKDAPGEVTVSYAYGTDPSSITVELRDTGVPFDPLRREDPTKPSSIQEAKIGGLGILMVKRTMDDFAYVRDDDTNVVVFKKGW